MSRNLFLFPLFMLLIFCFPSFCAQVEAQQGEDLADADSEEEENLEESEEEEEEELDDEEEAEDEVDQDDEDGEETGEEEEEPLLELPEPILRDVNMDEQIEIIAFGDSITRGVGDFISPDTEVESVSTPSGEAGYPLRIELLLEVPVSNYGNPGERLATQGLYRFAESVTPRRPDFVIISGGTNDAFSNIDRTEFFRSVQTMINISWAIGAVPIVATAPPVCCGHSGLSPRINGYNAELRKLAEINEIELADIDKAYTNTCRVSSCYLLNRPEGAHPNIEGYDISGEVITAVLLGIDIFAPDGPALLEQALGLPEGTVKTTPDPAPVQEN